MSLTNYGDVHLFHRKFGLPHPKVPQLLTPDVLDFRVRFMMEELDEFQDAASLGDLATAADSLIDLVYVAMGTAVMMGLPWQALWDAVQYANIRKVRAAGDDDPLSVRKNKLDVVKPPGWKPPDIEGVLARYLKIANAAEIYEAGPEQVRSDTYRPIHGEDEIIAYDDSKCAVCGERYDEHDGTEEHRFK